MLTLSWRKVGTSPALALALLVGLPAMAQAQLFPNLYSHRQRAACASEPPFYGHVRRDYFGYYPTCWQRFPEGWACPCPNPEAPNAAAAFRARPLDDKTKLEPPNYDDMPPDDRGDAGTGPAQGSAPRGGAGRPPGGAGPILPEVPSERDPFDLDPKRPAVPNSPGGPLSRPATPSDLTPGRNAPGATRPSSGSPFEQPTTPAPRGGTGPSNGIVPAIPPLDRPSASRSESATTDEPSTPLLALPEMSAPSSSLPSPGPSVVSTMPSSLSTSGVDIESADSAAAAAKPEATQAPRRTSLLGGLFGNSNRRRR